VFTTKKGAKIKVTDMEPIQGEARGIGEVAGPAIRFKIQLANPTSSPVSTANVLVNVDSGPEQAPGLQLSGSGSVPFPASVDAHSSASAVYVFLIAPDKRDWVRIFVHYAITEPIVDFEGAAPKAGA